MTTPCRSVRELLAAFEVGSAPIPEAAVEALRASVGADRAAVVGFAPRRGAVSVAFTVVAGDEPRELLDSIERDVLVASERWDDLARRYGRADPRRVLATNDEDVAELRSFMSAGPSLVAWTAVWRARRFSVEEERSFSESAAPVEERLRLAHDLAEAPMLRAALAATLEAHGAACIADAQGDVLVVSRAAAALLESDPGATRRRVHAAVQGEAGPSGAQIRRVDLGDYGDRYLVVLEPPSADRADLVARSTARWRLTARQRDVLALLADGAPNAAIAATLGVGERAVELHVSAILDKAGVANRAALIAAVLGGDRGSSPPRRGARE
jgi:DNA-binding CsgD family transcriptional regulator